VYRVCRRPPLAQSRSLSGPLLRLAVVACASGIGAVTLAVSAAAGAEHFHGKRYVANPSRQRAMDPGRAKSTGRRVVRSVFAVRPGTEIYACSRHFFVESGCDFQFVSKYGNTTCGNFKARAYRSRVVVYYDAYNGGCGDF
jgi:hypothetical protein